MNANPALIPTAIVAAVLFGAGVACHRRWAHLAWVIGLLLAMPCLVAVFYYAHLFDDAVWFYQLRSLRFAEISFGGIGFLGGVLQRSHEPDTWKSRCVVPIATAGLLLVPFIKPILNPLDFHALQDRCKDAVCLQSTLSTCGPASAASIIRSFGQRATERELALESYTSRGGTESWYLARAFRRRGYRADFIIQKGTTVLPNPSVAGVRLRGGAGHFIAILKMNDAEVSIVDPMSGRTSLATSELQKRYHFTGFFLKIQPKSL